MSIATEIQRLQGIKTDIRNALVNQGISAASSHNMADFEADILSIKTSAYAYIAVTYPEGATCKCVNGSTTLNAKDTSGVAVFEIPKTGTWKVTVTKGSASKTISVSITAQGQSKYVDVTLSAIVFDNGADTGYTFSNIVSTAPVAQTFTVGEEIYVNTSGWRYSGNSTAGRFDKAEQAIDVTPYKTMSVTAKKTAGTFGIGLCDDLSKVLINGKHIPDYCGAYINTFGANYETKTVDITDKKGSMYVIMGDSYNHGYQVTAGYTANIKQIILE